MSIKHGYGLLACVMALGFHVQAAAEAVAEAAPSSAAEQRVEHNLLPAITLKGEPLQPWSLSERMSHHKVPGVSIAVFENGKLSWARGYGTKDSESKQPVNAKTLFQAASISKPVSSIAALRLVEQGKLALDEPVNVRLKSWQLPDNEFTAVQAVTLRHLLSHSAGTTVHGFGGYTEGAPRPTTVQILQGQPPTNSGAVLVDKVPGESWRYSGGGTTIMQLLVGDATGLPFADALQQLVLDPAGVSNSTFQQPLPQTRRANSARAHAGESSEPVQGHSHIYPEQAAAGLWTTPSDLLAVSLNVIQSLNGEGGLLSQSMAEQMLTPQVANWGLGFMLSKAGEGKADDGAVFSHGGANHGFRSEWFAYRNGRGGAAIMTNSDSGGALIAEILTSLAAVYGWEYGKSAVREAVPLGAEVLAVIAGNYAAEISGFGTLKIVLTVEEGALWVTAEPLAPRSRIYPASATEFFSLNGQTMTLQLDADGKPSTLSFGPGIVAQRQAD